MEDKIWACAAELEDMLMFLEHCEPHEMSTKNLINKENQAAVENDVRKAFEILDGALDGMNYYGELDE